MTRLVAGALTALAAMGACGGAHPDAGGRARHELIISAAASLTGAFTEIGKTFEARNEGVTVTFNFGPSDGLARQIAEGAPVDVFAAASPVWMDYVASEGPGVDSRADFARNELALIVPSDNPADIEKLEDLANDGVKLVLAAAGVPAGDYARDALERAGIAERALANVVSNESDVRGVVTKVLTGDADAGIAYATDVTRSLAGRITVIEIPPDLNVIATYPIAVVSGSDEHPLARAFVDFVLDEGQTTLARYGFLPPA